MRALFNSLLVSRSSFCFPHSTRFTFFISLSVLLVNQRNKRRGENCYSDTIIHKLRLKKLSSLLLTIELHLDLSAWLTLSTILSDNRNLKLESHFNLWLHLNIFHSSPWIVIFNHSVAQSTRAQWKKRWEDRKWKKGLLKKNHVIASYFLFFLILYLYHT